MFRERVHRLTVYTLFEDTSANLGEADKALELLERGLEKAQEEQSPDPQLADLIAMGEEALTGIQ